MDAADPSYDHATEIGVQFRDLDTNRHVNNAVYVSYLEQGRAEYFDDVIGVSLAEAEVALARLEVEYAAPLSYGDRVTVYTRVPSLGTSSFPIETLLETDGDVAATAEATLVAFDPDSESARPLPERWRDGIARHEGLAE
jgi:acyl-CoA thioester hydrolase